MTYAFRKNYIVAVAMIAAAFFAVVLTPRANENAEIPDFEVMIPKEFGEWRMVDTPISQANLVPQGGEDELFPYDAVLMRAYRNYQGNVKLLAIAYTKSQKQERKIHRPELCYYSQGYYVQQVTSERRDVAGQQIYLHRLLARQRSRIEPLTYWIRLGDRTVAGPWDMRAQILWQGLKGEVVDGLLFRVSSLIGIGTDTNTLYTLDDQFIHKLLEAIKPEQRTVLTGGSGTRSEKGDLSYDRPLWERR